VNLVRETLKNAKNIELVHPSRLTIAMSPHVSPRRISGRERSVHIWIQHPRAQRSSKTNATNKGTSKTIIQIVLNSP
jgi:hypothetical protein